MVLSGLPQGLESRSASGAEGEVDGGTPMLGYDVDAQSRL
jgi:hypothetical protein